MASRASGDQQQMRRGRRRSALICKATRLTNRLPLCKASRCKASPNGRTNMDEKLRARALAAAAAVLDELGTTPTTHDELVTALAVAWLDGNNAGLADALAIAGEPVSA